MQKQITRDMEIKENKDGYFYFVISEDKKEILESDLFQTSTECAFAGMKMMDALHDEVPLKNDYIPTAADYIYLVKKEDTNENG